MATASASSTTTSSAPASRPSLTENCPICSDPMTDRVFVQPCGHDFDRECIQDVRKQDKVCPYCRRAITSVTDEAGNIVPAPPFKPDRSYPHHAMFEYSQAMFNKMAKSWYNQSPHNPATGVVPSSSTAAAAGSSSSGPMAHQYPHPPLLPHQSNLMMQPFASPGPLPGGFFVPQFRHHGPTATVTSATQQSGPSAASASSTAVPYAPGPVSGPGIRFAPRLVPTCVRSRVPYVSPGHRLPGPRFIAKHHLMKQQFMKMKAATSPSAAASSAGTSAGPANNMANPSNPTPGRRVFRPASNASSMWNSHTHAANAAAASSGSGQGMELGQDLATHVIAGAAAPVPSNAPVASSSSQEVPATHVFADMPELTDVDDENDNSLMQALSQSLDEWNQMFVDALPTASDPSSSSAICPICTQNMTDRAVVIPCFHEFDFHCINSVVDSTAPNTCPACGEHMMEIQFNIHSNNSYSVMPVPQEDAGAAAASSSSSHNGLADASPAATATSSASTSGQSVTAEAPAAASGGSGLTREEEILFSQYLDEDDDDIICLD